MSPPTTPRGSGPINEMLNRKQLELVTPDSRLAQMQLDQARESLELASEQVAHRPEIALTVAYDASRKAVVAMLEAQGLRAKLPNAHLNVQNALSAQWSEALADEFGVVRKARNRIEYPDSSTDRATTRSAKRAVALAQELVNLASEQMPHLAPFKK